MERGKIHNRERIETLSTRQADFSKRRSRLFKEAHELAVLCDAQVAVLIPSSSGKMYEYPRSSRMKKILERYAKASKDERNMDESIGLHTDNSIEDQNIMSMENIRSQELKMLNELEQQIRMRLCSVEKLKDKKIMEQIQEVQLEGCFLLEENHTPQEKVAESQEGPMTIASYGDDVVVASPNR